MFFEPYSVVYVLVSDRSISREAFAGTRFLCAVLGGMPANNKQKAQKGARCGMCKNCVKYGTKKKCLNPKDQPQEQQAAAAQFSSPVTRRQSDAGRDFKGKGVLLWTVGGYADGASEHPNPETL